MTAAKIYLLLCEMQKLAKDLPGPYTAYLQEDLHRVRGRLMQCTDDQSWQRARGTVAVTVEEERGQ